MTISDKIKVTDDFTFNMYMKCFKSSKDKTKCPFSDHNCEGTEKCHMTAYDILKKMSK